MKKPAADYHFERKKQLAEYKGNQSRLKSILEYDHGEAIKNSMVAPKMDREKETISKEEFFENLIKENR